MKSNNLNALSKKDHSFSKFPKGKKLGRHREEGAEDDILDIMDNRDNFSRLLNIVKVELQNAD